MYYGLLTISVVMFGIQFFFNDRYKEEYGSSMVSSLMSVLLSSVPGVFILLIINGFSFDTTPFTVIMATVSALSAVMCTFCTLKALEHINLSLYSLFSMLGGMILPFMQGLLFYGERMTLAKGLCFGLIAVALLMTVDRNGKRGGAPYYIGVFFLNGMNGVYSKFFQEAAYEKTNEAAFSMWIALMSVVIAAVPLSVMFKRFRAPSLKAVFYAVGGGVINRIANYLLLIALAVLPASVQYPFITGGVMIVSTVISVLAGQKPSKKEIGSVLLAFAGILLLVAVPL